VAAERGQRDVRDEEPDAPGRGGRRGVTVRVAIVTGAARGIGLAIAERVAAEGAVVVAVGRDGQRLREAAERLGERALPVVADVSDREAAGRTVADVLRRFGRIDVLVNNAGIGGRTAATWEQTDADWDAVDRGEPDLRLRSRRRWRPRGSSSTA
jgi:NADP-dependent 3-hydroxy acid dehydrogenase YdfG